jgi:hypothetical protein
MVYIPECKQQLMNYEIIHTDMRYCPVLYLGCSFITLRDPSIHVDASYQVSVHMAKQFQRRRFFRNRPIRNKNCMWWPCLPTDRDYSVTCLFYTLQVGIHILIFFLANLTKGNMSFCHHLVSVVCHAFTFHILIFSSENPQPNELKLGRHVTLYQH